MPARGRITTEESRQRYREAAQRRPSQLIRFGIVTEEQFNEATAQGLKWCTDCKAFVDQGMFAKAQRRCRSCASKRAASYHEKNSEQLNSRRVGRYYDNHDEELRKGKERSIRGYGASPEWYAEQLARQDGKCAICKSETPGGQGRFHIDHNHGCHSEPKTACDKCRRGLLCSRCNIAIARFESDPGWAERALAYLRKYGHNS